VPVVDPVVPKRIGRYEVERLLGQGGMGRVWLARDTVLGRRVAIKVLRDDLALPPAVKDELIVRMGHEARAAAAVSHPNIVTLHDMGEDPVVGLFLVFEYVTTKDQDVLADKSEVNPEAVVSLRDRLKRGPLPFSEVAKLARELGTALTFAHEAGVIHRDVKPENILFSRNGFKIADFGIARIPDSTITRANTVLGTPAYTAPEALSKGDFGPASDQFSLAATLYEAATGARAFGGEDAIVTAGKVSSEPPPPLHESIGPESIVKTLDATLQRGLAKSAAERFASCAELGAEVARVIEEGQSKSSIPPPATATARARRGLSALMTPVPTGSLMEGLERTPLSSRVATVQRAAAAADGGPTTGTPSSPTPSETNRPSIYLRKRTHRFQNIAVGIAIVTIIVLVLIGRRSPPTPEIVVDQAGSITTTIGGTNVTIPASSAHKSHPKPSASPSTKSATTKPAPSAAIDAGDLLRDE
jgi:eukaryotic-like serine/threonine-protein kinase